MIDVQMPSQKSDLKEQYLRYVIESNRWLDFHGVMMTRTMPPRLDLEHLYVRQQVMERSIDRSGLPSMETLTISEVLSKHQVSVILGDPGAGKTTLLRYMALSSAKGILKTPSLPILVPLAAAEIMLTRGQSTHVLEAFSSYHAERSGLSDLKPLFESALESGEAIVLLDGLDEIIDLSNRAFIAEQVWSFVRRWAPSGNCFVITSRIVGYREALLPESWAHYTLVDFSQEEIANFVRGWFPAFELAVRGDTEEARHSALQGAESFLASIARNTGLYRLAANPLLLTILCLVYQFRAVIPERRVELYALAVDTLLESWESAKGLGPETRTRLDYVETAGLLAGLALWFQQSKPSGTASALEILEQIKALFVEYAGEDRSEYLARTFLDNPRISGVFTERGLNNYGFTHLAFQEFFAARRIAALRQDDCVALLRPHLHEPQWREVVLLTAGQIGIIEGRINACNQFIADILFEVHQIAASLGKLVQPADIESHVTGLYELTIGLTNEIFSLGGDPVALASHIVAALEALAAYRYQAYGSPLSTADAFLAFWHCCYRLLQAEIPEQLLACREVVAHAVLVMKPISLLEEAAGILGTLEPLFASLDKAQRVPGIRDKQNYYLNALDALADVQLADKKLLPSFQAVMRQVTDHWNELISAASRQLRERAELRVILLSLERPLSDQVDVALKLVNPTISTASNVSVTVIPSSSNYEIVKGEVPISFIPAEGEAQVQCIIRPLRDDAVRIAGVVRYDDLESKGKELPFADVITFTGAEPFRKPPLNPYVAGPPIRTPEGFYGRGELIETIRRDLQGTVQDNIIALYGQRRTGKSSLLYQLKHRLGLNYLPVLMDMEGIATQCDMSTLFWLVAHRMAEALQQAGSEIAAPDKTTFVESPAIAFEHEFLPQIKPALGKRRAVLMLDEFEALQMGVQQGNLNASLFHTLRHLMQHESSLAFVFCGAHRLQELIHDYWSVFFNAVIPRRVTFLSEQETQALITEPASEYFAYDELAVEKIYRLTHGHPYFTQLLCHILVNHVQRSPVVSSDVDAALRDLIDTGNEHLDWIWAQSTPWEKAILWALTKLESRGVVILSDITAFWRERGKTVAEEYLNQAITQLVERELVRRDENRVAFTMGLIPAWIAHCQSEQNVRQEVLK